MSLRPLSLFLKLRHGTVSKGRLLAFFWLCTHREVKYTTRHHRRSSSAQLLRSLEVHPLPSTRLKGRSEEKAGKIKLLWVESQCLQGGFWTQRDTGKKYQQQKIRRTATDRLPEAVGGWLSQSPVSAPPPPPTTPPPHLCCDENGCPPRAQQHSRALSGN